MRIAADMSPPPSDFFELLPTIARAWTLDSKTIDCPPDVELLDFPVLPSSLYVRPCYRTLVRHVERRFIDDNHRNLLVTGSEGVGKTVFAAFLLVYLLKQVQTGSQPDRYARLRYVVYENQMHHEGWLLDLRAPSVIMSRYTPQPGNRQRLVEGLLRERDTWYICDASKHIKPQVCYARTLVISEPCEDNYRHWQKETVAPTLYMPVWSLDELLDVAKNHPSCLTPGQKYELGSKPAEVVMHRYSLLGGNARLVFAPLPTETLQQELDVAVCGCNLNALRRPHAWLERESDAHMVLHYQVDEDSLQSHYQYQFASQYVAHAVATRLYRSSRDNKAYESLMAFVTAEARYLKALRSAVFENITHFKLQQGAMLGMHSHMADADVTLTVLARSATKWLYSDSDVGDITSQHYGRPAVGNFPTIYSSVRDAHYVPTLFQMAAADAQDINVKGLTDAMSALGVPPVYTESDVSETVRLVCVVPAGTELYRSYKLGKLVGGPAPLNVQYYVAYVGLTPLSDTDIKEAKRQRTDNRSVTV